MALAKIGTVPVNAYDRPRRRSRWIPAAAVAASVALVSLAAWSLVRQGRRDEQQARGTRESLGERAVDADIVALRALYYALQTEPLHLPGFALAGLRSFRHVPLGVP